MLLGDDTRRQSFRRIPSMKTKPVIDISGLTVV